MNKIKIAIVGTGNISNVHIKAYLKNPNVELYAFCDIDEEKLKARGAEYGITRLYTDEETMLRELPEIDAVSVCTWNSAHAPCAILALRYGKHVLCEKPMAMNASEAQAMIDAAYARSTKSYTFTTADAVKGNFQGDRGEKPTGLSIYLEEYKGRTVNIIIGAVPAKDTSTILPMFYIGQVKVPN